MKEQKRVKLRWRFLTALIGAIGAAGEAYFLWHILVNRLPYKETAERPLFVIIANKSFFAAPLIAVAISWLFTRTSLKWGPAIATVICPAVFVLFYIAAFSWVGIEWSDSISFAGTTKGGLLASFAWDAARLATAGAAIGILCGLVIELLSKRRGRFQ